MNLGLQFKDTNYKTLAHYITSYTRFIEGMIDDMVTEVSIFKNKAYTKAKELK